VNERGAPGEQSTGVYLRSEVDSILAPIICALVRDKPHGKEAITEAIARLLAEAAGN
jgi:hypothetical protein